MSKISPHDGALLIEGAKLAFWWLEGHLNARDVGGINPEWALSDKDWQSLLEAAFEEKP